MFVKYHNILPYLYTGKPERKRPLRIPRHRWEDNIRMDVRKIVWEDVDCKHMAQGGKQWQALVNRLMNLQFP
jgi:hypothetical protein